MFHSGHNPGPVDGQRPLGIQLHVGIGVTHLSNEQIQQYHNHHEEECQVNDHTKPPGSGEKWCGLLVLTSSVQCQYKDDKPWLYLKPPGPKYWPTILPPSTITLTPVKRTW